MIEIKEIGVAHFHVVSSSRGTFFRITDEHWCLEGLPDLAWIEDPREIEEAFMLKLHDKTFPVGEIVPQTHEEVFLGGKVYRRFSDATWAEVVEGNCRSVSDRAELESTYLTLKEVNKCRE